MRTTLTLLLLFLLASCGDLAGLNHAISDNRQAVEGSTQAIQDNHQAVAAATDAITANAQAVPQATTAILANIPALQATNKAIAANADAITESTRAIAANARTVEATTEAIKKNAQTINDSTDGLRKNVDTVAASTVEVDKNARQISLSAGLIQQNGDIISKSTQAVKNNADAVAQVTQAIQRNADAIAQSTAAIADNERTVRLSTAAIQHNHDTLAALSGSLNSLTLDQPATRIAAVVLAVTFLAVFALLATLVWTMLGIRRSLFRIQAAMAAGVTRAGAVILLIALAALLPACGQNIWMSTGHPATTADHIRILIKTPARYERLGTVTHLYAAGSPWQNGADATPIIQDLLSESATMGANALLLLDDTTMADTTITLTYQGKSYTLPVIGKTKTVLGQALYVTQE